ncbi:hypothetical protein KQX54_007837 [Cotesia glomerata]|uniref:Uncharacterized protein n=1 Tax=Cotesia glomerata TaxID=32391 RepID=A0AAV7J305_COTGL|nr:hypothetical protein KQX54_007837 [Cotesia glomerata]
MINYLTGNSIFDFGFHFHCRLLEIILAFKTFQLLEFGISERHCKHQNNSGSFECLGLENSPWNSLRAKCGLLDKCQCRLWMVNVASGKWVTAHLPKHIKCFTQDHLILGSLSTALELLVLVHARESTRPLTMGTGSTMM